MIRVNFEGVKHVITASGNKKEDAAPRT
jgi:hypothetical protein